MNAYISYRDRVFVALAGLFMFGLASVTSAAEDDILQTGARLQTEEQRQMDVRRHMNTVVRRMGWLLEDLASNELLQEAGASNLVAARAVLSNVESNNLPAAARMLRAASTDLANAYPLISDADEEIEQIIRKLDRAIQGANTILVDDRLLKELRELIKSEEFMRRQTAEWGKKTLIFPEAGKLDQGRLSRAQQTIVDRYLEFFSLLRKTADDAVEEESRRRFGSAVESLDGSKPESLLTRVIDQIRQMKANGAVGDQDRALEALRAAEKILGASEGEGGDLVTEIAQILTDEKELRALVGDLERGQFQSEQSQLEARQLEIGQDLDVVRAMFLSEEHLATDASGYSVDKGMRDYGKEVGGALEEAKVAIGEAVNELSRGSQKDATVAQDRVIAALEMALAGAQAAAMAMADGDEFFEESLADGSDDLFGDDAFGDDAFGDDLFEDDLFGDDFFGDDGFGEAGFGDAGFGDLAAGEGQGEGMGQGEGQGQGQGEGQGMGQGQGKGKGPGQPTPFQGNPGDLEESSAAGTSSTVARGRQVDRTRQARDAMTRRQRSAAIQNYVQQLPPEFRQQVADFYESISR